MGAGRGGIGSIAGDDPGQHAQEGGRVALRLVSELRLYGKQLIFVFALVVLGSGLRAASSAFPCVPLQRVECGAGRMQ